MPRGADSVCFYIMNTQPLYDLTPLASLLLVGLVLALGPVIWVYRRSPHQASTQRIQALRMLTLFLTFDLILFGAFTRLTDSGLGCPDWPGCYGSTSPWGANHDIATAQAALPTGPVTQAKAWIEMLHRYLATAVGGLILMLALLGWNAWRDSRQAMSSSRSTDAAALFSAAIWASITLAWVCLQGAFGALTVTMKLFPAIVTLHLAGALVLFALLGVQVVRDLGWAGRLPLSQGLARWLWVAAVLLVFQVLLGGWVSTNYAVLACSDFPQCQNHWWPDMNLTQGFELWRHLGVTGTGEPISFAALTGIHYMHRLIAYLVLGVLAALAWQLNRQAPWRSHSRVLAALVGLQLATGLSNVVFDWPLLAALLHTGGAAALVLTLVGIMASKKSVVAVRHVETMPASLKGTLS